MFKKLVETKNRAIEEANNYFTGLQGEINEIQELKQKEYAERLTEKQKENITIFNKIVMTPKEYLDLVYNSGNFKKYLQYTLAVKEIWKKIYFLKLVIVIIALVLSILIGIVIENKIIAIIIGLILVMGSIIIVIMQETGMSYEKHYMNTMSKLMISVLPGYSFEETDTTKQEQSKAVNNRNIKSNYYIRERILTNEELRKHFSKVFDYYKEDNTLLYSSPEASGGMCDIEIIKEQERTNQKTGAKEIRKETILNGFYIKNIMKKPTDLLHEYVIQIREDDNLFSELTEDTIHSIYKSEKEFTFNTEELNKALDCKIKYEDIVQKAVDETAKFAKNAINKLMNNDNVYEDNIVKNDADPTLILEKVITPFLEDRFLYLRKRYNSFNMNLSNSYISFNVNLNQSFFQKFQAKQIWKNEYKKHTEKVSFVKPAIFSNVDFEYYKQFPMLEKLYFIHYINLLYRFALKSNEITSVENDIINRFESEILEVMEQKYSEFKSTYSDDIKQISSMVKDTISEIQAK